jgi:hypothetical protein
VTGIDFNLKGTAAGKQREISEERGDGLREGYYPATGQINGDGVDNGGVVDSAVRVNYPPLQRSEPLLTNLVCLPRQTVRFFSASSSYPGRGDVGRALTSSTAQDQQNLVTDSDESESESDWHSHELEQVAAPRRASKFSQGILIEVCSLHDALQ